MKRKKIKFPYFGDTQSSSKLWAYVEEIVRRDKFQRAITRIRKKYEIPIGGYRTKKYWDPCEEWRKSHTWDEYLKFSADVNTLCGKYELHTMDWGDTLRAYLFYNKLLKPGILQGDLCKFVDLKQEAEEPLPKEIREDINERFPLAIRISPYASKRDILDFTRISFGVISKWQEDYKNPRTKIGKVRTKKKREIYDFIYANRDNSLKVIADKLAKEKGVHLDEGHIGKIRSIERKRRDM